MDPNSSSFIRFDWCAHDSAVFFSDFEMSWGEPYICYIKDICFMFIYVRRDIRDRQIDR